MPTAEDQIQEFKRAYQILDAPLSASAASIKQKYRKLTKRWHPDRYASGTPEYAEATEMTKLINGAYAAIQNAPLRYHIDACPTAFTKSTRTVCASTNMSQGKTRERIPATDWLEFWIRFVFGALLGAGLSIQMFLVHYDEPGYLFVSVALIFLFAFAAAQSGDNFWHSVLRRWWLWW